MRGSRRNALPNSGTLERMLYYLKLTRESEWRIENVLYRQGKIVGGVYVGRGQEAIGVGAALTMRAGDVTFPCHRDFSIFLIRGFSLADIFANWLARADSPNRGRDNTLHIGSMKLGIIPIISPLGATLPVACGVGMVLKQRGQGNVAMVHFGEGTTSLGNVHEAMNFAAVLKLPVIFICNNNQYAYSTPVEKQFAVKSLAVRGPAYGMPGESVDGTDVLAVYDAVDRASARARAGKGPSFLECVTLRMAGHSAHDAAEYVPEKLKQAWAKKDPILRLQKLLLARKTLARQEIEEIDRRVREEIDLAIANAEARPLPRGEEALEGVYCGPDCWWRKPPSVVRGPSAVAADNRPRTRER
ncbi:MAG: thiamine pyrophosphate-dependent dehydrogenase E1 component subunit alpha [Terriglobia bacterium]